MLTIHTLSLQVRYILLNAIVVGDKMTSIHQYLRYCHKCRIFCFAHNTDERHADKMGSGLPNNAFYNEDNHATFVIITTILMNVDNL